MQRKLFLRTILLLMSAMLISSVSVWAQDMDYNLDQYAAYERVVGIADPVERAEAILVFMREHEGLSLVGYALKNYGELLEGFRTGNGTFPNYLKYAEKLMGARPEDTELAKNLVLQIAFTAYQMQDHDTAIKYSEKAYEQAPAANLALVLANSYAKKDDKQNFTKYGQIALQNLEPSDPNYADIAVRLRSGAIEAQNFAEAAVHSKAVLNALEAMKQPENVSNADWQNYVQKERSVSQLIIARSLYETEKYGEAIKAFEKITSSKASAAFRSEAYYYIGLSHWKQNSLDPAMRAFVLGSVLKSPGHSEACEKYLIQLYKSTHNDSTAGLDELIARITNGE